jgi:hypothetical protein
VEPNPVHRGFALCIALLVLAAPAFGDAIVRSRAMNASTIAELFIEEGRVRVELEIGERDLRAFRDLLPDELLEPLGFEAEPWSERLPRFMAEGMPIQADDGPPLAGRLVSIEGRERQLRDEISGQVRPPAEGETAETVLFALLEYPLPGRPERLALHGVRGPAPASLGFVVYHGGVAVNDFRYMSPRQVLLLDWDDPWYTAFESRALRRQYYAPMSGFLYVEPYEVRKEIIARPLELQRWVDLGLQGLEVIPPEMQAEVLRKAGEFLREHHVVEIDDERVPGELARIHFLERSLRTSRVIDPPEPLDIHAATLGAIFVYPTEGLPDRVTLDWDLWHERLDRIPAATVDQAEADWRELEWQNFLKNPVLPTLLEVARPAAFWERALGWLWGPLIATGLLGGILALVRRRRSWLAPAVALAVAGGLAFAVSGRARVSDERAGELLGRLLHNVYRAFDFRDEERIYDTLARSVAGDLLEQIYLETRRGLELQSQGGARAKVKEVSLDAIETAPAAAGAFTARATWQVGGSVGHWGHVHERRNRYRADLTVAPVEGEWRLTRVEILEEERL